MSAEIINLRQARKQKQRQMNEKTADDNRRKFGRSKAERDDARRRRDELEKQVDGHKLDKPETQPNVPDDNDIA
jgi:Domain of unknown function (DUF4169)